MYEDAFCSDISDLMDVLDIAEEKVNELDEDWKVEVIECSLEKIFKLEKDVIVSEILDKTNKWEDRFPEESEQTDKKIRKAISAGIDIDKINSLLPSLYYPNKNKVTITKKDLVEFCS